MGVGYQGLQLTLLAKRRNADFSRTITLGRQNHYMHAQFLREMCERFEVPLRDHDVEQAFLTDYAEGMFRALGAQTVDSMDASDYEGANIIHDLNRPIGRSLIRKYTCVADFGTLEHIYNFPTALKNATDMLVEGGWFMSCTIANNFMGHGFYQFSPELFLRYLPANGFTDVEVFLVPCRNFPYFFKVNDPKDLRGRVELVNAEPVVLSVLAYKRKHVSDMVAPIQSDYYDQFWKGRDVNRGSLPPPADPHINSMVAAMRQRVTELLTLPEEISPTLVHGFANSMHYSLIDPAKV